MTGQARGKHVSALAVLALIWATSAGAQILFGPVTNQSNGNTYYLLERSSWSDAEAQAVALGGHLATVRTYAENTWLVDTFGTYSGILWIGLSDGHSEGTFVWTSGEGAPYRNWINGNPSNVNADDDYVGLVSATQSGPWINVNDTGGGYNGSSLAFTGVVEIITGTPCICDVNGDHAVDLIDLPLFAQDYQSGADPVRSDFNRDGHVDLTDIPRLAWALGTRECP